MTCREAGWEVAFLVISYRNAGGPIQRLWPAGQAQLHEHRVGQRGVDSHMAATIDRHEIAVLFIVVVGRLVVMRHPSIANCACAGLWPSQNERSKTSCCQEQEGPGQGHRRSQDSVE